MIEQRRNSNGTKWLNLSHIDNTTTTTLPSEKNKNYSKCKTKENNTSLVTQRVKVNISKKKGRLNTSNSKKPIYLENKLTMSSPREFNTNLKKQTQKKVNFDSKYKINSEQRRFSQVSRRLRHNKSCEDGIFQIANNEQNKLLYNSMININNENDNLEPIITDYQDVKQLKDKRNFSNADLSLNKNTSSKKYKILANSLKENKNIIPIHSQSNLKDDNSTNNVKLIKKLEEDNFQLIEDAIIDKNFEKHIEQDDMILSPKMKEESTTLENKIEDSSFESVNSFNFENKIYEKSNNDDEDNFNNSFENLKNDFEIFYTDDYFNGINNNMIKLEFQFFLEKIFDLQSVYHYQLNDLRYQNNLTKKLLSCFHSKFITISKKKIKLIGKFEISQIKNNYKNFVFSYKGSNNLELISNNKKECNLWKNIFNGIESKNILTKEIFKKVIIDKYNIIKGHLNEHQKKICEKLTNKYQNNIVRRKEEKRLTTSKKTTKKNMNKSNYQILKSPTQNSTKSLVHLKSYSNLNKNSTTSIISKSINSSIKQSNNNNKNIKQKNNLNK